MLIRAPVSEFRSWWANPAASWARIRVRSDCWIVSAHLPQLDAHPVDRTRQLLHLVLPASEVDLAKVPPGDKGDLLLQRAGSAR